ncbi:MAG: PAS domain-containing protein, partial [Limisphaerales bacterium]
MEEAEETLRAIRCGEVDALVVSGPHGHQVYSLETAEHSYRVMVEAMSEGAVTLTGGGTIVYSNRSFATMVKMPLEEVIGSTMLRLVHAEDLPKFQSIVSEGCNDSSKGEIRLQTKGGSIVPVYFSVSAVETGNAPAVCAVVTDLTTQKRNQELLVSERLERVKRVEAERARERIANILESITDCFFALDRDWQITDVNQRAATIYRRNREDLLGQVFWNAFPQKKRSDFQQRCHTAMLERTPAHFEARSRVVEGCWLEFHLYPSDEGLAVYFRDITARKETEEKLHRSEIYLAEGQRLSHTASWAWKVSTGEVYWSAELFRIFGLDPERVKPAYPEVLNYIHPDDRNRVQSAFQKAVREKADYELAYRVVRADGGITHVNNIAHPVFDKGGRLVEYVGTTVDTTERVQAEEQLLRSEARFRGYFELGLI